jgi:hypothetical protein
MEQTSKSCGVCGPLIRRCANTDFFPKDAEVRALLIDGLHRASKGDHATAKAAVDLWLETESRAPRLSDFGEMVAKARTISFSGSALPAPCATCRESGGFHVIVDFPGGQTGARRCDCARGQALRRADEARQNERQYSRAA